MRLAVLILFFAAWALPAPPSSWTILGPGGGGAMFYPTVSPHDDSFVVLRCDMTGAYVSRDGGDSWRMFNLRGTVRFFAFDPLKPNVLYAYTSGLWRSQDAGLTWRLLWPWPVTGIINVDDHASERLLTSGSRQLSMTALAIDPADSRRLYASVSEKGAHTLQVSTDYGRTWISAGPAPDPASRIYVDPTSPPRDRTLYWIGRRSVHVRRGGAWTQGPSPLASGMFLDASAGFARPGAPLHIYAISDTAIHVSPDGGATWRNSELPGQARLRAVATSARHPEVAYVSYGRLEGKFFGVARTGDGGASWDPLWKESTEPSPNIDGAWVTERFGPGWGSYPISLGVSPANPNLAFGTDYGRTMRTRDGGKSWQAVYTRRAENGWISTGLDVTTCYGVHFDPTDPNRVFITYTDIGLFRSEDGGRSWVSSTSGVPRPWVNTTYWMEFDPAVKGRVWAVASGIHDLPRPKMWRNQPISRYNGGVLISDDGARSWRVADPKLPPTAATHILLDPSSPVESRTLYFAGFGRGVFKSTDGGASWSLRNQGIEGTEPFAWRLARASDATLYLVVARRSDDGRIGDALDGALYRSTDAAATWNRVPLPAGVNGPNGLTVDRDDPRRLYLSVWRRATPDPDGAGGIYLTTDAGASWRRVFDLDQHIYDVTQDGRDPRLLYACGFNSSVWRSTDRGLTWRRLAGYNFKWGHRVIPDPRDSARIYVTTFGGSLWYGPAAGDPRNREHISTPRLSLREPTTWRLLHLR